MIISGNHYFTCSVCTVAETKTITNSNFHEDKKDNIKSMTSLVDFKPTMPKKRIHESEKFESESEEFESEDEIEETPEEKRLRLAEIYLEELQRKGKKNIYMYQPILNF